MLLPPNPLGTYTFPNGLTVISPIFIRRAPERYRRPTAALTGFPCGTAPMNLSKLRRQIAWEAARLMYQRQESEYFQAKQKAARRIYRGWVKPSDLPSNAEIRDQVQAMARMYEGSARTDRLRDMRLEALRMMGILSSFRPRLIGSVMTGHIRQGSDIDIHVFSDSVEAITAALDYEGMVYDVERKKVMKQGEERRFIHIHVQERFPIELTIYATSLVNYVFKSSITGKAIERATVNELEQFLQREYPGIDLEDSLEEVASAIDGYQLFESLLLPLENVKQSPKYHPEGDALYHSLQVFDLACDELPYDEEFLLAAFVARCRQSDRSLRSRRRRLGSARRVHHSPYHLADRASHDSPTSARQNVGPSRG